MPQCRLWILLVGELVYLGFPISGLGALVVVAYVFVIFAVPLSV